MRLLGKKILICGNGVTGKAVFSCAKKHGAVVNYAENREYDKSEADFAVLSPGISKNTSLYVKIKSSGIPIFSEADFGYFINPAAVRISVSGTNGKTTVVRLIAGILRGAGINVTEAGNIGVPFCAAQAGDVCVCELSSFMLEQNRYYETDYSAITNIAPDHIEWHGDYANYTKAKLKLYYETKRGIAVELGSKVERLAPKGKHIFKYGINYDAKSREGVFIDSGNIVYLSQGRVYRLLPIEKLAIGGQHNLNNALCALSLSIMACGYNAAYCEFLKSYHGEPYRQQKSVIDGKLIINDSKATNCAAALAALSTPETVRGNVAMLLGGSDKGEDYSAFFASFPKDVYVFISGGNSEKIADAARLAGIRYQLCSCLEQAVQMAMNSECETVLFSPAAASFDRFSGYEERGRFFDKIVAKG